MFAKCLIHEVHVLNGMLSEDKRMDLCPVCAGYTWGRPSLPGIGMHLDFGRRRCSTCAHIRDEPRNHAGALDSTP